MRLSSLLRPQSGHSALLGALRREAAAASATRRTAADAERLRELLRQRDMDAQRAKMIIRLKEDKVARLQVGHRCGESCGIMLELLPLCVMRSVNMLVSLMTDSVMRLQAQRGSPRACTVNRVNELDCCTVAGSSVPWR